MKYAVLGTSFFTIKLAEGVLHSGNQLCALISMPRETLPINSADIESFAKNNNVMYFEFEDINSQESVDTLKNLNIDIIVSSWPKIIKNEILTLPKLLVGTHPTNLPHNRGRHPLHWLLALGIKETKQSFFWMDSGIDSGKILLQLPIEIEKHDDINTLNQKAAAVAYTGIKTICKQIENSTLDMKQQEGVPNYWRARNIFDSIIDLRMGSEAIINHVKSFTHPYPCAKLIFKKEIISILEAEVFEQDEEWVKNMEYGKIYLINGQSIVVKCCDSLIKLIVKNMPASMAHLNPKERYIYPPAYYIQHYDLHL
ncbi:MAG: formyltransferase family protein [Sulfuricurvum sp.]